MLILISAYGQDDDNVEQLLIEDLNAYLQEKTVNFNVDLPELSNEEMDITAIAGHKEKRSMTAYLHK